MACVACATADGPDSPAARTEAAATRILFDYGADDFAAYQVKGDGYLHVTFARNTPDALYSEILNKLQNDPEIRGVIAGKVGAYCARFR